MFDIQSERQVQRNSGMCNEHIEHVYVHMCLCIYAHTCTHVKAHMDMTPLPYVANQVIRDLIRWLSMGSTVRVFCIWEFIRSLTRSHSCWQLRAEQQRGRVRGGGGGSQVRCEGAEREGAGGLRWGLHGTSQTQSESGVRGNEGYGRGKERGWGTRPQPASFRLFCLLPSW